MSLAFVRGIHQWPVNSLHKGPVMRKMSPFDDVIMVSWNGGVISGYKVQSHYNVISSQMPNCFISDQMKL